MNRMKRKKINFKEESKMRVWTEMESERKGHK